MGSWQMMMGNFDSAEHHHCRAMELNPNDAYIRARRVPRLRIGGLDHLFCNMLQKGPDERFDYVPPCRPIHRGGDKLHTNG